MPLQNFEGSHSDRVIARDTSRGISRGRARVLTRDSARAITRAGTLSERLLRYADPGESVIPRPPPPALALYELTGALARNLEGRAKLVVRQPADVIHAGSLRGT